MDHGLITAIKQAMHRECLNRWTYEHRSLGRTYVESHHEDEHLLAAVDMAKVVEQHYAGG